MSAKLAWNQWKRNIARGAALSMFGYGGLALPAPPPSPISESTDRVCELGQKGNGYIAAARDLRECIDHLVVRVAEEDSLGRIYGRFGTVALAADRDRVFRYYEDTGTWVAFRRIRGNPYITLPPRSSVASRGPLPRRPLSIVPVLPDSGAAPTAEDSSPRTNNTERGPDDADKK